ncbi:PLDc N-terminal domain-containing protein [Pontibacter sp. 172403-2]|nr:PLDc N-terminal domain-containing protein [Pontibacter sp. 172403-2]
MANVLLFIGSLGAFELFILIIPALLWLYALVEILTKSFKNGTDKIVWLLVVLLLPVLGFILYYAIGRSRLVRS